MKEMNDKFGFDLMIFTDEDDYLCYVEAVELLIKELKKKECSFIHDKNIYKPGMYTADFNDDTFL